MKGFDCPDCCSASVPIVYGLPGGDLFEAAGRGEVELGGCVVFEEGPDRRCVNAACRASFVSNSGIEESSSRRWD